jgi:hypothetical protein
LRSIGDGGPRIVEERREDLRRGLLPGKSATQGIVRCAGARASDPVDSSRRPGVADPARGAVLDVPASRIDDEETSVRRFEDIRWVEVRVLARDEVLL